MRSTSRGPIRPRRTPSWARMSANLANWVKPGPKACSWDLVGIVPRGTFGPRLTPEGPPRSDLALRLRIQTSILPLPQHREPLFVQMGSLIPGPQLRRSF